MTPEQITDIRRKMRMNKQQFAEQLGVRPEAVTRYEAGQRPPTESVNQKLTALATRLEELSQPHFMKSCVYQDNRGVLRVWGDLPFPVVRTFSIEKVPQGETRGKHAHKTCDQVISSVVGSFRLLLSWQDGSHWTFDVKEGFSVYVPRMTWIRLTRFSTDAVAYVLCTETYYPENDYTDRSQIFREGVDFGNSVP